jgi:hypothetical protein
MQRKYLPVLLLIIILVAAFLVLKVKNQSGTSQDQGSPSPSVVLKTTKVEYNCEAGKSAFEMLAINSVNLETKDSSFGKMITKINETEQGDGKYWLYSIDDKEATVSADTYICQDSERVKWELK